MDAEGGGAFGRLGVGAVARLRHRALQLPQSSVQRSADRPAKFQWRPNARRRQFSARETVMSGAIQYSLLRMVTEDAPSLPRTGATTPSMMPGIWKMRVSPLTS